MKAFLLYRTNSETERLALDFQRDFEHQTGKNIEMHEADSLEAIDIAKVYDIVDYPAIIVVDDNGSLLQLWQGPQLPRINEVSYFVEGK